MIKMRTSLQQIRLVACLSQNTTKTCNLMAEVVHWTGNGKTEVDGCWQMSMLMCAKLGNVILAGSVRFVMQPNWLCW